MKIRHKVNVSYYIQFQHIGTARYFTIGLSNKELIGLQDAQQGRGFGAHIVEELYRAVLMEEFSLKSKRTTRAAFKERLLYYWSKMYSDQVITKNCKYIRTYEINVS